MNKIKGLIFDLDGVLVNTKKIHYEALNIALLKVGYKEISYNDHLNIYDGLPTTRKLEILTKNGSIEKIQMELWLLICVFSGGFSTRIFIF